MTVPIRMTYGNQRQRQRSFGQPDPDARRRRLHDRIERRTLGAKPEPEPPAAPVQPDTGDRDTRISTYLDLRKSLPEGTDWKKAEPWIRETTDWLVSGAGGEDKSGYTDPYAKKQHDLAETARTPMERRRHAMAAKRIQEMAPNRKRVEEYRERMSAAERAQAEEVRKAKEEGTWKGGIIRDPRTGLAMTEEMFERHQLEKRFPLAPRQNEGAVEGLRQKAAASRAALVRSEQSFDKYQTLLNQAKQRLQNAGTDAERRQAGAEVGDLQRQLEEIGERSTAIKTTMDAAQSQAEHPTPREPSPTMAAWEHMNRGTGAPDMEALRTEQREVQRSAMERQPAMDALQQRRLAAARTAIAEREKAQARRDAATAQVEGPPMRDPTTDPKKALLTKFWNEWGEKGVEEWPDDVRHAFGIGATDEWDTRDKGLLQSWLKLSTWAPETDSAWVTMGPEDRERALRNKEAQLNMVNKMLKDRHPDWQGGADMGEEPGPSGETSPPEKADAATLEIPPEDEDTVRKIIAGLREQGVPDDELEQRALELYQKQKQPKPASMRVMPPAATMSVRG